MSEAVRVHTLRLRALARALPMAPQPWVEDALRCAPVPGAWRHRWVLVRRLQVRMGTKVSSAALADALGAQWQQLAAHALPAEQAPEQAAAVWFADEPAARVAWLLRRLQGAPLQAWFWQRVRPLGAALADDVAALLHRPWREAVGAAREQVFRQQVLSLCVAHDAPELASREASSARRSDTTRPTAVHGATAAVATRPVAGENPVASPAEQATAAERLLRRSVGKPTMARATPLGHLAKPEVSPAAKPAQAAAGAGTLGAQGLDAGPQAAHTAAGCAPSASPARHGDAFTATRLEAGMPTQWAGFFWVLNLWRPEPPPDADTAWGWLHALAAWLLVPAEDGVAAWLSELGPAPLASSPPLRAWRLNALQLTRLPLRRLLAAPGLVRASATHVDLHLPLRSARLLVRKAGLDIDPGWQPLLQRVVAFHYDLGVAS